MPTRAEPTLCLLFRRRSSAGKQCFRFAREILAIAEWKLNRLSERHAVLARMMAASKFSELYFSNARPVSATSLAFVGQQRYQQQRMSPRRHSYATQFISQRQH